jgi:hypothetical protein
MGKFDRRKVQTVYIFLFFLILVCILVPNVVTLQRYPDSSYGVATAALPFYPEDDDQIFLKPSDVYQAVLGRSQILKYIIVISLAILFLFNGYDASVFACSLLYGYLIRRSDTSVIAFSLGGRAPPRI